MFLAMRDKAHTEISFSGHLETYRFENFLFLKKLKYKICYGKSIIFTIFTIFFFRIKFNNNNKKIG